jgi:hypothetical protein
MNNQTQRLADADHYWSQGRLRPAYELYSSLAPVNWHAAFQKAWIDAAFGPVSSERLAALDVHDLSQDARELLQILVEHVQNRGTDEILPGTLADWDIDSLKTKPTANERKWWEQCGDLAIATGQWGLAEACFDEAANLAPEMYYDPPARVQGLLAQIENHLHSLKH